jgi:hypothetical protein
MEDLPATPDVALLHLEGAELVREHRPDVVEVGADVVGVRDLLPGLRQELLVVAQELLAVKRFDGLAGLSGGPPSGAGEGYLGRSDASRKPAAPRFSAAPTRTTLFLAPEVYEEQISAPRSRGWGGLRGVTHDPAIAHLPHPQKPRS